MSVVSLLAVSAVVAGTVASAQATPIRVISPGTGIFLGNVIVVRGQLVEASTAGVERRERSVRVAGNYSPTTNTLVGLVVPLVEKEIDPDGAGSARVSGIGDMAIFGQYRLWNRVGRGVRDMAAVRVALEFPTGRTGARVGLPIPEAARRSLQPGSGSTDVTFLLAAGRAHYRYSLIANASYRVNTTGDGRRVGDRTRADVSGGLFLMPRWTRARRFEVVAVLELLYHYDSRSELAGTTITDSGGHNFAVAPALQVIIGEHALVEVSLRLPAGEDLNGNQPRLDHDLLVGMRVPF